MLTTTDLAAHIRLGMHHLMVNFDETADDLPWFDVRLSTQRPGYCEHYECFDSSHVPGRCLDALLYGEAVTGLPVPDRVLAIYRRYHLDAFDADDGLNGYVDAATGRRTVLLHNLREGLLGLNALIAWRADADARAVGDRMVEAVTALIEPDGGWDDAAVTRLCERVELTFAAAPGVTGRFVGPLLRFAELTGSAPAFELALRLARHVDRIAFASDGSITDGAGTHVHSISSTISGLCELAARDPEAYAPSRALQIYRTALAPWRSSFGWVKELIGPAHLGGEVNSTGDLVQAALTLARIGADGGLYNDAERMLRSHVLPAQVMGEATIDPAWMSGEVESRMLGGFGFPTPNDRAPVHYDEAYVRVTTLDITSGAVQAMARAFEAQSSRAAGRLMIHLLLDREDPDYRLRAIGPGLFEITASAESVDVRLPTGTPAASARFTPHEDATRSVDAGPDGYLRITGAARGYLTLPPEHTSRVETLCGTDFRVEFAGEQLMSIEPRGEISPIDAA